MRRRIIALGAFALPLAFGGLAHADISGPADPIAQAPAGDDCLGTTTRWTLQPCGNTLPAPATATAPAVRLTRPRTCVLKYGEQQRVPNIQRPCQLDIYMTPGKRHGLTPQQRCDDMGGTIAQGKFKGHTWKVCRDASY